MKKGAYEAAKLPRAVLLDDHRISHAWAAAIKRGREIKGWTLNEIRSRHAIIVKELKKKGYNHWTPL